MQSGIPSGWIGQADLDFEAEGIGVVIIVGTGNGEGDGLDACQGGLKLHLPRGFVPIIHIRHVKQLERHVAVCPRHSTTSPFYTLSHPLYTFSRSVPITYGMRGWKGAVRKIDLDAFFPVAEEIAPFHPLPQPAVHSRFVLVGLEDLHGIPLAHASGRAKNRPSFHLALFSSLGFVGPEHLPKIPRAQ